MLVVELMKAGIPCVEIRPTVLNFSAPMKHLDGLIRAGRLEHDGCPVMTWMIGNTVAMADAKDNVYPRKEQGESKIDGTVALLMALARDMAAPPPVAGQHVRDVGPQAGGGATFSRRETAGTADGRVTDGKALTLQAQLPRISGRSERVKAIRYTLARIRKLRPYLKHRLMEVDNNAVRTSAEADRVGPTVLALHRLREWRQVGGHRLHPDRNR